MTDDLERIIKFRPAFDRRHPDPNKNYGVHGVEMKWVLKGAKGAVQFVVFTNWHLPHVTEMLDARLDRTYPHLSCHPQPSDLGYHSPVPMYADQEPVDSSCEWTGGVCYYDGSTTNAESVFETLVREGDEACWAVIEKYYQETFKEDKP